MMQIKFWCSFSILWSFNVGDVGDGGYILGGNGWWCVVVSIFWEVVGGGGSWWVVMGLFWVVVGSGSFILGDGRW